MVLNQQLNKIKKRKKGTSLIRVLNSWKDDIFNTVNGKYDTDELLQRSSEYNRKNLLMLCGKSKTKYAL